MTPLLLLEDDNAFARVLSRQLAKQQYDVTHIEQVQQLLPTAKTLTPDVVLLDMNIDGDSSIPMIGELRALLPASKIILVTGYASIATTVAAIKAGADDYLPKPIDIQALLNILNSGDSSSSEIEATSDTLSSPERMEWEYIQRVLNDNKGNISATARQLNMHRRTLQRKLSKRPVSS
ncbi:response regulator transcription factor [Thalassotalea euphylliae]|uniref:response regulator transcription factor n=1 Tax=Thalassotalea euphylliae TaxID=1655234 RepID=UPI00362E2787